MTPPDVLTRVPGSAAPASRTPREVSLDDKYELADGLVFLSGIHALVRVTLDQMRSDRRAGHHTREVTPRYVGAPHGDCHKEHGPQIKLRGELSFQHGPA